MNTNAARHPDTLPMRQRAARFEPSTFRAEDNSVEVVFTAGAAVRRYDLWNDKTYEEVLDVTPEAIDLSRFEAGAVQVLDNHAQYGVRSVLGICTDASVANSQGTARVRLSTDPDKAGIIGDIKAGILRSVSVGYSVQKYELTPAADRTDGGGVDLWRAIRWTPHELSFVCVPADPAASTRSAPGGGATNYPVAFTTRSAAASQEYLMADKATIEQRSEAAADQPTATGAPETPAASSEQAGATANDATRAADIADLCQRHGIAHLSAGFIRGGNTLADVKDRILQERAMQDARAGAGAPNARIETVRDETQTRLAGMQAAIMAKLDPNAKLDDNARQYRHMTLLDMGREHLGALGINVRGVPPMELVSRMLQVRSAGMHTVSDFGNLLGVAANRRLRAAYEAFPATYREWARRGPNLTDFKPVNIVAIAGAPDLLLVNEHGEYKYGTFGDSAETYKLATYGRIIAITRQAIINDDLRGFDRTIGMWASSAARLENRLAYEQITSNGALSDGVALFHADHSNLLTGNNSKLSLGSLSEARAMLRSQKGMGGEMLNLTPTYLIVPAALETLAYQLTNPNFWPTQQSAINEFAAGGRTALTVVVDPMLDASSTTAWYLAARPELIDTVEYAYLDGADGPVTETREGFEVDGTEFKCRLDFVAKAIDFRGMVKAAGA